MARKELTRDGDDDDELVTCSWVHTSNVLPTVYAVSVLGHTSQVASRYFDSHPV